MSDLPPPPSPPGGWPQQPGPGPAPAPPGAPPRPYDAPPAGGPWGPATSYGYSSAAGYSAAKAGFWARFGAFLIDGIIVGLMFVPGYVALLAGPKDTEPCRVDESGEVDIFDEGPNNAICEVPSGSAIAMGIALFLVGFAGALTYYGRLEGRTGQTVGAKATGISVVDIQTGQPIGTGRAIGRYFARILSGIPCYLGYFWMLWDDQKQTWHDKMTSSVVVRT